MHGGYSYQHNTHHGIEDRLLGKYDSRPYLNSTHIVKPPVFLQPCFEQILGNNECIEPYTSNMYVRRVRAGEFIVVNPHLLADLVDKGLWTKEVCSFHVLFLI